MRQKMTPAVKGVTPPAQARPRAWTSRLAISASKCQRLPPDCYRNLLQKSSSGASVRSRRPVHGAGSTVPSGNPADGANMDSQPAIAGVWMM